MPEVESKLAQFRETNTQVLGVSVDSQFCHANWATSLGGISYPLLADFHPKGELAQACGLYLSDKGISDRATVIIDASGKVQYAESVTPAGKRNIDDLIAACAKVNSAFSGTATGFEKPKGVASSTLYVKNRCAFSLTALNARTNLHLQDTVTVKNISEDAGAKSELTSLAGKEQAPCLVTDGKPQFESKDIVQTFLDGSSWT